MSNISFKYKIGIFLIDLISKTWRIKLINQFPSENGIVAFWHNVMLPGWFLFRNKKTSALVSSSKDGEILTFLLEKWGYQVVRGSSSKGGKEALEILVNLAKNNNYVLITPDGPQGPNQKMKAGAIIAAQRSKVPLYLCAIYIKRKITFNKSWDKFQFPLPFSKIFVNFTDKIFIEANKNKDEINEMIQLLEKQLNNMTVKLCSKKF